MILISFFFLRCTCIHGLRHMSQSMYTQYMTRVFREWIRVLPEPQRMVSACSPTDWPDPVHSNSSPETDWARNRIKQVISIVFPKDNSQHQPHSPGSIDMCVCEHVLPLQLGANHNFLQLHNVGMPQPQQQVNLSQAADGDPWQEEHSTNLRTLYKKNKTLSAAANVFFLFFVFCGF